MNHTVQIGGYQIPVCFHDTLIIGSGASGFSAAEQLAKLHHPDTVLITEHIQAGTSRNTGSDKQTYYKLTLSGEEPDSVEAMAKTLMAGGCADGDLALCEAALSARCFMHLVELGVPFPCSQYGEFIGYKTDHDPKRRATSAGPYTSRMMTEVLEQAVMDKNIPIYDHMQVIRILTHDSRILGVLCLDLSCRESSDKTAGSPFMLFQCRSLIYATGGPAGMYLDSVYPHGHFGSTGLALEAGVLGKNLTEWQYGLASKKPRWNVSGTYMQSLPRFISTLPDGSEEREFLSDFFEDSREMLQNIFLKGYQWPFDVRKINGGSSIIDILVYLETQKGRKVFLDFRRNPREGIDFKNLPDEVREYLQNCGACFGTPFERLKHMNEPAAAFYKERGVDLEKEPLEIALCAQHNNGGLSIDKWWQTNIRGFFCVGEASCSHGVYRPGGTALNSGQVGALRAAQYISAQKTEPAMDIDSFVRQVESQVLEMLQLADSTLGTEPENVKNIMKAAQERMSRYGAAFRNQSDMETLLHDTEKQLAGLSSSCHIEHPKHLTWLYRLRDILICQRAYLTAMVSYSQQYNLSRGSALYTDLAGSKPYASLPDTFTCCLEENPGDGMIQEIAYSPETISVHWRRPRPLPDKDDFFENVWKTYRENRNIF